MKDHETGLLEGPEMTALRGLRAEVEGPSDEQRRAAWERAQGAGSQAGPGGSKGGRPWLVVAVAAVAAGVVAVGVGVSVMGGGEDRPAPPATTETEATPTNPNPAPYATGSVWEPQGSADEKVMRTYREENIHLLPDGGVRIDIPEEMDWMAMTRSLNAEGIPVRFWAVQGTAGEWETAPEYPIDPERGLDTSEEPSGEPYPMDRIEAEYVDGEGTALTSLTFVEIPTEPVDIEFTQ